MKNGVPTTAVRMPSGISIDAPVRAMVSMNKKKSAAEEARDRQQAREIRPDQCARKMRHHKADPADDSGRRNTCGCDERRRRDNRDPQSRGRDAERARFFFRQRHHIHAKAQAAKARSVPSAIGLASGRRSAALAGGETAEQPEGHGRKLVVRIGEIFHEPDAGAEQRADHHAGEHEHKDRIARADRRADQIDGGDRNQARR